MSDSGGGASHGGAASAAGSAAGSGGGGGGGTQETQQKQGTQVSVQVDPQKVMDMIENKAAGDPKVKEATHEATHAFKVSVDNTSWASFKSSIGDGSALSSLSVYGDPKSASSPESAGIHADLFTMHWHDVAGVSLKTTIGDDLKWTNGKSLSDDIKITQDATWKNITLEGEISTSIDSSGKVNATATAGLKFTF